MGKKKSATAATGKCLMCGKEARLQRGLCAKHHQAVSRMLKKIPDAKRRAEADESLIAQGVWLRSQRGARTDLTPDAARAIVAAALEKFLPKT